MATLQSRVEDYVGTITDTTALTEWLNAGVKYLIGIMPKDALIRYATPITFTSNTGVNTTNKKVLDVIVNDRPSTEILYSQAGQAALSTSIHYATSLTPVYYVYSQLLCALPTGVSCKLIAVSYPSLTGSSTTIAEYPIEFIQAVVLYAAIQAEMQKLSVDEEDIELSESTLGKLKTEFAEFLQLHFNIGNAK